jgi:hypothetical protein
MLSPSHWKKQRQNLVRERSQGEGEGGRGSQESMRYQAESSSFRSHKRALEVSYASSVQKQAGPFIHWPRAALGREQFPCTSIKAKPCSSMNMCIKINNKKFEVLTAGREITHQDQGASTRCVHACMCPGKWPIHMHVHT